MLSRRQFIRTSLGATGAVLSSALWIPAVAHAAGGDQVAPIPIPGGVAPGLHVFLPGHGAEPSTIFDLNGFIGIAHLTGTGTGTDTSTGATTSLLFDIDNRFMQGTYVGVDGEKHQGTFGFVWLDLYQGSLAPANQIHDFNPGIAPSGLFWTIRVPDDSVEIELDEAEASLDLSDLEIRDFFTLANALKGGKSVHADASFHLRWSGVKNRVTISDETNQFTGNYIEDTATISWSAQEAGFKFVSDPASTSTTVFAEIGKERNGFFFHNSD